MGILNVTPDSFSGDGLLAQPDWVAAAVAQALAQIAAGADIIDIGGESTRPGSPPISLDEELHRVIPVIRAMAAVTRVPISVDTSKAEVARQALAVGATMINDVWGFKLDPAMAQVAAKSGTAVVLMHNRSRSQEAIQDARLGGRYVGVQYDDLMQDVARELAESVEIALAAGVAPAQIIIDPGLGFGKTVEQNLELIDRLGELRQLGYPLLVGPSRKSFTGAALQLPPDQRLEGTAAAVALTIDRGADIVRVHDVAAMRRVAVLADAITRRQAHAAL
ncbi:dihydropteroate synthase [Chloroflexales bacterium ZM16-3]|nr:dihydropteroate synthase [Chloroflexales bacterium ZM16-3]